MGGLLHFQRGQWTATAAAGSAGRAGSRKELTSEPGGYMKTVGVISTSDRDY
jgi:hypothetical protein